MNPAAALAGVSLLAAGMFTSPAPAADTGVVLYAAEVTVAKVVVSRGTTGSAAVRLAVVVTPVAVLRAALRPQYHPAFTG
ncbi:hypothetical protein H4696_002663 [Amycolatopsis lexingtonensis]|uniref:Uncharacterized protein n=1 Tax=Amycolatopsis lexingtonensis TaxID=218822 RepID=A0ABR9HXE3_9PSEU|nr:hypothetical protein [Amycolatopsis lexingtonensis]MBE1495563.1 hypothetical protein [Amycolatopsis lexingtonensis]